MPASAFFAVALAWAALPLAITGPAGMIAGGLSLYFRSRFGALERFTPGLRGARLLGPTLWMAAVGVTGGALATGFWLVAASTTTVPAK